MNKVENIVENILYMKITCETDSESYNSFTRLKI